MTLVAAPWRIGRCPGPAPRTGRMASSLLNELGGLTEVEEEDSLYLIRSHGCPLAAATADHPEACNALESLLSEFVGTQVKKCCDRYDRARCCFEIRRDSDGPGFDGSGAPSSRLQNF